MVKEIESGIYHLLHPKMTFFLTSISKNAEPNIMTCAWATPVSEEPPMVVVCVAKESYTAELIQQTREFVINIPSKSLVKALWICGKHSGRDTDKFRKAGIEMSPAKKVAPPVVGGCIGHIECSVWKAVGAGECYAFFGTVLSAYADARYFKRDVWTAHADIPLHLGGKKLVYFR